MNDIPVRAGDIVVSRVTGAEPTYHVGTIIETTSDWVLESEAKLIVDRKSAIRLPINLRTGNHRVWLFDRKTDPSGADHIEVAKPKSEHRDAPDVDPQRPVKIR
jgi:hypothetical protein